MADAKPPATSSVLEELCSPYLPFDPSSSVWSNLLPTPQSDITSSSPMCPILYNPPYSSAMDLYRTLTTSNTSPLTSPLSSLELSPRALALTSHLIQLNPSHFSIWQYRANVLLYSSELEKVKGGRDAVLQAELEWLESLAHQNMKSYQVWQHRRVVVSALAKPGRELGFVEENLDRDAKNYHTWGYRQWVLSHFGGLFLPSSKPGAAPASRGAGEFPELWQGEEEYVDKLLTEDVRNNSAWNHRWFVNFSRFGLTGNPSSTNPSHSEQVMEQLRKKIQYEIAYTKASLSNVPNNASGWNYLRALHTSLPSALRREMKEALGWVKTLVSSQVEAEKDAIVDIMGRESVGALEWWLDCIAQQQQEQQGGVEEAEKLVKRLIMADPVRKRFYAYRLKTIRRSLTA
ncbi:hypothetical protein NDA13_003092 [Ustilago tritici]|nr:hypothetical protein NDA13_003092 [Ustilago tritici]